MIWFTSDLHFCHDKPFIYKPRGFDNIHDMNEAIVKNFNEVISRTDDLYILGDCMLNNNAEGMNLIRRLPGKIHIIRGNHDTEARVMMYFFEARTSNHGYADIIKENGYYFYLSHYPTITSNFDDDKPLKAKIINLCGHTHTKDKFADMDKGICYHVELDAHNNYPVDIETIINDIKGYKNEK